MVLKKIKLYGFKRVFLMLLNITGKNDDVIHGKIIMFCKYYWLYELLLVIKHDLKRFFKNAGNNIP